MKINKLHIKAVLEEGIVDNIKNTVSKHPVTTGLAAGAGLLGAAYLTGDTPESNNEPTQLNFAPDHNNEPTQFKFGPEYNKDNMLKYIQKAEGFKTTAYDDPASIKSIGYGFNLDSRNASPETINILGVDYTHMSPEEKVAYFKEHPITREQAGELEKLRYNQAQTDIRNLTGKDPSEMKPSVRRLFTDMDYNMGTSKLGGFHKALDAYKHGDYKNFANEVKDSKFYNTMTNNYRKEFVDTNLNKISSFPNK